MVKHKINEILTFPTDLIQITKNVNILKNVIHVLTTVIKILIYRFYLNHVG